jgi:hypothetical protein
MPFLPGQLWTYDTRPGEENSRLTILAVEANENRGAIVHIRVDGVAEKNPYAPDGVSRVIHHMPFAEVALEKSVRELVTTGTPVPATFQEGYKIWKDAFLAGKAGIFTLTVAEAIQYCEGVLNKPRT